MDLAFSCNVVAPLQLRSELVELGRLVRERRPKTVMEIGTCNGGTLFVLCRLADPNATIISLDLPGGKFGGGYRTYRIPVMHLMKAPGQRLRLLRADSHSRETRELLVRALQGVKLDFLLIDGDHSYEGVKQDFEMYSPFVSRGGIVAFHDIVPHPPQTGCKVEQFWNEVKTGYQHREIVENPEQGSCGIGVLFV